MKKQVLRSFTDDTRIVAKSATRSDSHVRRPLPHLQKTVENRDVAGMIQRHEDSAMNRFGFKVEDSKSDEEQALLTSTGESQEDMKGLSDVLDLDESLACENSG